MQRPNLYEAISFLISMYFWTTHLNETVPANHLKITRKSSQTEKFEPVRPAAWLKIIIITEETRSRSHAGLPCDVRSIIILLETGQFFLTRDAPFWGRWVLLLH